MSATDLTNTSGSGDSGGSGIGTATGCGTGDPLVPNMVPDRIAKMLAQYTTWTDRWWNLHAYLGVGGIATAAIATAYKIPQGTNSIVANSFTFLGLLCAGGAALLTPDKRSDWSLKARDHLANAVLGYEFRQIQLKELLEAAKRAAALARGEA